MSNPVRAVSVVLPTGIAELGGCALTGGLGPPGERRSSRPRVADATPPSAVLTSAGSVVTTLPSPHGGRTRGRAGLAAGGDRSLSLRPPSGGLAGECRRWGGWRAWTPCPPRLSRAPQAGATRVAPSPLAGAFPGGAEPPQISGATQLGCPPSPWIALDKAGTFADGDCRLCESRFKWGAGPPRRTPIVKSSRRWRDAACGGLDIGGRRDIHASFPPRRPHWRPGRPCGRRRG
jgi:hypothetical protein